MITTIKTFEDWSERKVFLDGVFVGWVMQGVPGFKITEWSFKPMNTQFMGQFTTRYEATQALVEHSKK